MSKRIYDIVPISGDYKGISFRSRLEIRWAIFFDELGWNWSYEDGFFKLPSGNYLPDFYFPDLNIFAEAKPNELNEIERKKCIELSELFKDVPVLLLIGEPSYEIIKSILNGGNGHDLIPVSIKERFYPFYLSDTFDVLFHIGTTKAVSKSINHSF